MVNWVRCQFLGVVTAMTSSSLSDFHKSKEFSVFTRLMVHVEKVCLLFFTVLWEVCRFIFTIIFFLFTWAAILMGSKIIICHV